ncbi:uncharacterized protein TRIVIDRAFT_200754 [Trichoderma virens Gv29-8]|uniref:Uncharacterized protein n=1 Tax=Hypocrea virens (strain Gv29-8 / FGSC 10586) TaxID=413071 RepID=G9MTT9_HYPVG|nr:uncharacterized protein TRIVIDRAFT_200754 [Trichoderma virens Gv29-8]EHK22438.1 hypothetical protein TRIVIDRAFT_200754 [Trichoderma virens Gv29-8]
MELTKVHVRGKRKTPATNRPQSLQEQPPAKALRTRKSLSTVMNTRATRRRKTLDSLPAEILESIFLYSGNLSLPRVSNFIGMKLSARATLLRLFMRAFHETWDQWFGIPTNPAVVHGPWLEDAQHVPCRGDPIFQSQVLDQPWITIDLILQAQQTWFETHGKGRHYQHSALWVDDAHQVGHAYKGGVSHFNARECFEVDYQQAAKWPAFATRGIHWFSQDIHPLTRIPDRLITGPWDDEMQRQLFWLCRGGYMSCGKLFSQPPWEVKMELIRNSMLNVEVPNVVAINCLYRTWVFDGLPADVVRKEFVALERRIQWGADSHQTRDLLRRVRSAFFLSLHMPEELLMRYTNT